LSGSIAAEEAYLLGCLFGRGSIEVTKSKNYQLIFRIPFREYSPVMVEIVGALLKQPRGLSYQDMLNLPTVKANKVSDIRGILMRLKNWHPPGKRVKTPMLTRKQGRWKISTQKLARSFLDWEEIYLQRERVGIKDFVLKHLKETTTFLATSPDYHEEISAFGVVNHIIK